MQEKDEFEESRRHLALEVLVTLSETSSAMVRKLAKKYMPKLGEATTKDFELHLSVAVLSSSITGNDGRSGRR